jgi:hypothetical protein
MNIHKHVLVAETWKGEGPSMTPALDRSGRKVSVSLAGGRAPTSQYSKHNIPIVVSPVTTLPEYHIPAGVSVAVYSYTLR